MSTFKQTYLMCDTYNCGTEADYTDRTAAEVRRINAEVGWVRRGGHDFCPACAATAPARRR